MIIEQKFDLDARNTIFTNQSGYRITGNGNLQKNIFLAPDEFHYSRMTGYPLPGDLCIMASSV